MCDIRKYPELYLKANSILRVKRISNRMPGYELLRMAIVVWKVEGENIIKEVECHKSEEDINKLIEKELIKRVEEIAPMNYGKGKVVNNKSGVEQAMIEAIRAISKDGVKTTILDFVMEATNNIF